MHCAICNLSCVSCIVYKVLILCNIVFQHDPLFHPFSLARVTVDVIVVSFRFFVRPGLGKLLPGYRADLRGVRHRMLFVLPER